MLLFDVLAENRIREAMEAGVFQDLPGAGRPLDLHEDPLVPPEMRMAVRVLKNAGCLPPELATLQEIRALEASCTECGDDNERRRCTARIALLMLQLERSRAGRCLALRREQDYMDKVDGKVGRLS